MSWLVTQVTGGAKAEAVADQWELAFAQPASDYLRMKSRLERDNVCLENVIIKESENRATGTVKVSMPAQVCSLLLLSEMT